MVCFIHTSDLHLGKRFGQFPEELRGRLTEARHQSIDRLVKLAQSQQAEFILVAGDVFDTGTPSPAIIRQSLRAMGSDPSIKWVLMPGNHDSLAADELWKQVKRDRPDNVILALENVAVEINASTFILPAPCENRRPGRDLTEWMTDADIPADALRIGLAHGAVQSFDEDGASEIIVPDRAQKAGLDYLALGEWHGQIQINERTWYSGAPEADRFKHDGPGKALVVSIETKGAKPDVKSVETGSFNWLISTLSLLPGEDTAERLFAILPEVSHRRETMLRVILDGRVRLPERLILEETIENLAPDFAWMETLAEALENEYVVEDLDLIDQEGALRQAAETLLAKARLDDDPRGASATALSLLYSFAAEKT